jgi:hypothetical protein
VSVKRGRQTVLCSFSFRPAVAEEDSSRHRKPRTRW